MPTRSWSSGSFACAALLATALAAGSFGCGAGDFMPPPPPELQGSADAAVGSAAATPGLAGPSAGVRGLELIFSGRLDPEESEVEKSTARSQAGIEKARIRITVPVEASPGAQVQPASTAKDQATLVREAIARRPQVLIVEPADPADRELAKAVGEARAAKIPVVLLGRPVAAEPGAQPAGASAAPLILVAPPPFAESARQLVASAIRNAKNAQLKPEGGAILLINTAADTFVPDRVAALRDALRAAGITSIVELPFRRDGQVGRKLLTERLQADPKPVLVFGIDFQSTSTSNQVASEGVEGRPFVQAGYTSDENFNRMVVIGDLAGLAEFATGRVIRKAISTAVAAAQGRDLPGRVEVPVVVHDSPPQSGLPSVQAVYKARMKSGSAKHE
jgi:hypothetical protein